MRRFTKDLFFILLIGRQAGFQRWGSHVDDIGKEPQFYPNHQPGQLLLSSVA